MTRALICTLAALAVVLSALPARAAPRVTGVLGATCDVRAVAVDRDAILLGTSAGVIVVRDGHMAQTLGARDRLPGARVLSLSATDEGVWVGGADGVALLARDGAAYRVARTQPIRRVMRVAEFVGMTYFATFGDGLLRAASSEAPERVAIGRDRTRVSDLAVVGDRLWIATIDDGVIRLAPDGKRDDVRGLPSEVVWDLEPEGDGVLAATAAGVAAIPARGRAHALGGLDEVPVRDVRAIARAGGVTWLATFGAGAWRLENGRAQRIDATPETRALALAGGHAIVGSARGATRDGAPLLASAGLPSADVTALASAFGALWVGSFAGGVARVQGGAIDVPPELAAIDPRTNDLAVTREADGERLWIATDRGLWSYDGRAATREVQAGEEHVGALHVATDGALWVAASRRLLRRDARGWQSFAGDADARLAHVDAIATDRAGRVWVAGLYGVVELAPDGSSPRAHTAASGALSIDWATSVIQWQDGVVIGTYDAGLSWYDGAFHVERDVPGGWINAHAMRAIGDELWLGTLDRGLVIGRRGAWRRLRIADGLPSDDVTALLPAGDRAMWVGTRGGVARVEW